MTETAAIADSLVSVGLAEDPARLLFARLEGGVSSDIWRVDGAKTAICVKRARKRLAVAATWEVPVERNHYEAEFLRVVSEEVPGFAPELLAEDEARGLIVLPFLDPGTWRLWKTQLLAGEVDIAVARTAGTHLGRLARATRGRPDLAKRFGTLDLFFDLRLDPYLMECARRHPDLAAPLTALVEATSARREALVHGDVSPKNMLVGAGARCLILDAECAWYGDPAFDLAFLVNHLCLKAVHVPGAAGSLAEAIGALLSARAEADATDEATEVARRAARLLPGLLLARLDGKSPVEYLTENEDRAHVRDTARRFLLSPAEDVEDIVVALTGRGFR
jgi:tRNA A-37 threonylcarbamoyl transferase component Bud32